MVKYCFSQPVKGNTRQKYYLALGAGVFLFAIMHVWHSIRTGTMKRHEAMINRAKMAQQRNMGMWDTMVNEVESVGLGVAEAVKDEVIAIEEDIAKIEEVAGERPYDASEYSQKFCEKKTHNRIR